MRVTNMGNGSRAGATRVEAVVLLALAAVALAEGSALANVDGVYVQEGIGGYVYGGDLSTRGNRGAPRLQFGVGMREGANTVEVLVAAAVPDLFFIDCYGDECSAARQSGFTQVGLDFARRFPLVKSRWARLHASLYLRGGLRWNVGDGALDGMQGPGVGGGAGISGEAWVLGYFIDFGADAMWLHGPSNELASPDAGQLESRDAFGTTKSIVVGFKLGWL